MSIQEHVLLGKITENSQVNVAIVSNNKVMYSFDHEVI